MNTIIVIFSILLSLCLASQAATVFLSGKQSKVATVVCVALHLAVFPLFPYIGIEMKYCVSFFLASLLFRFILLWIRKGRKGETHDL